MTVSRRALMVAAVAAALAAGVYLWRTYGQNDDAMIARAIASCRDAIEHRSLRSTMAVLSPTYHDNLGLDHDGARRQLQRLFLGIESIRIDLSNQSPPEFVRIGAEQTAIVSLSVVVVGMVRGQALYLLGTPKQPAPLTLTLRKEERRWLINGVSGLRVAGSLS